MIKRLAFLFLLACSAVCHAQGTFTAASCSRTDVNAVINGPTHTAVSGDKIIIPATGSPCTWTSGIAISGGVGFTITGPGTPNSLPSQVGAAASTVTLIHNAGNT